MESLFGQAKILDIYLICIERQKVLILWMTFLSKRQFISPALIPVFLHLPWPHRDLASLPWTLYPDVEAADQGLQGEVAHWVPLAVTSLAYRADLDLEKKVVRLLKSRKEDTMSVQINK